MGSRSVGAVAELLLRPSTFTRLPLYTTASCTRIIVPSWGRRTLATSTPSQTARPQRRDESTEAGTSQPSTPKAANPYLDFVRHPNAAQRSPPSSASDDRISQSLDNIFASTNNPNFRRRASMRQPVGTATYRTNPVFGEGFSDSVGRMKGRKPRDLEVDQLQMPEDLFPDGFDPRPSRAPEIPESEKIYPRLNPSYGRKVDLDPSRGRDLVRGIKMLTTLCHRNKVKADLNRQRFHERPGLKRKRLKSERWRARFKVGFEQVTSRVRELTRKGW